VQEALAVTVEVQDVGVDVHHREVAIAGLASRRPGGQERLRLHHQRIDEDAAWHTREGLEVRGGRVQAECHQVGLGLGRGDSRDRPTFE
jgi:hypothetical protein